jgi:hypothetical protein
MMTEVDGRKQVCMTRPSCGKDKTSTAPASGAEIEFRNDCSDAVFSGTDVAVINPPRTGFANVEAVPQTEEGDDGCNPCDPGDCAYDPRYCAGHAYDLKAISTTRTTFTRPYWSLFWYARAASYPLQKLECQYGCERGHAKL